MDNRIMKWNELMKKAPFNGVILLAEDGKILFHKALGHADRENHRLLTQDSIFELASLSKPFTATAIMMLAEAGKLTIEDQVTQWIAGFPYREVAIEHLLNHTSGIPEYMELLTEQWDHRKIAENSDVLDLLMTHQPEAYFHPGEDWAYTNTNYVILALLIERVSGKPFATYLQEEIFVPLGMRHTFVHDPKHNLSQSIDDAHGYVYDLDSSQYVRPTDVPELDYVTYMGGIQGDGAIKSNAKDLLTFEQALYTERLVSRQTLKRAMSPTHLPGKEAIGYGWGWLIDSDQERGTRVGHTGGWPGYSTCLYRFIDSRKTLIFLCNEEMDPVYEYEIIEAALAILFHASYEYPKHPKHKEAVKIDIQTCQKFEGIYQHPEEEKLLVEIKIEEDRLYCQMTGQVKVKLHPLSETVFFIPNTSIQLQFVTDQGQESLVYSEQEGETISLTKLR